MDTKPTTNIQEKKSVRRQIIDDLLIKLENTMLLEKRLRNAIDTLQYLCSHENKEYEGTSSNGAKILDCVDCKKRFYEE